MGFLSEMLQVETKLLDLTYVQAEGCKSGS